jgi:hypothetical protein
VDRRQEGDNIWSLPLNGGAPQQVTHFHSGALFRFDLSRDGKQLVFCRALRRVTSFSSRTQSFPGDLTWQPISLLHWPLAAREDLDTDTLVRRPVAPLSEIKVRQRANSALRFRR